MLRPHGQPNLALSLNSHHERKYEFLTTDLSPQRLGLREQRTGHRPCRMDNRFQVRIIIVVNMRRNPVDQSSVRRVRFSLIPMPKKSRRRRSKERPQRVERRGCRPVLGPAQCTAEPVVEAA